MKDYLPSLTILLFFAFLLGYEYIRDLRRALATERENGRAAWRLYERTNAELSRMQGRPVPTESLFAADERAEAVAAQGFRPGAVGPTAILDRELRNQQPRPPKRTPRPDDIAAAAREATNNGELQ